MIWDMESGFIDRLVAIRGCYSIVLIMLVVIVISVLVFEIDIPSSKSNGSDHHGNHRNGNFQIFDNLQTQVVAVRKGRWSNTEQNCKVGEVVAVALVVEDSLSYLEHPLPDQLPGTIWKYI